MKKHAIEQISIFLSVAKWLILSSVVGIIIGASVTLFLKTLQFAEQSQTLLPFKYYYLLPFALLLTVWLVKKFAPDAEGHGTEKVIEAVHKKSGKIEISVIPVKLLATVLTVFSGGSVGKEGPGAQIGAGMASFVSDLFHFSKEDRKTLVICGIGAGFASVFGTPIAGAIFGVEVLVIGLIRYDVLLPSFIAGFSAFTTAQFLGIEYTYFDIRFHQHVALDIPLILQVVLAGLFFGLVSDITITMLRRISRTIAKIPFNIYVKAFGGGLLLVGLSFIVGDQYFGLGLETIDNTLQPDPYFSENIPWYSFLLKTLFTSITLGVGGSGGIVTPIFYIGATSGHFFGTLMGDHFAFFAALGFISVLAGTTNAPIAATIMAMELFGLEVAHYAAISVVISFLMTGHRSVFSSQILAMKKSDILKIDIGEDISHTKVNVADKELDKIKKIRKRFRRKRNEAQKDLKGL
ncbi:MAG: voltage-gated chloride channel [Epsilonproteobacteria bacterium]|nr:MAG: voltage-gated chloride channel [Campylobacterota bacterium]